MATLYQKGTSDTRPWGTWEVLETSDNCCVKKICVLPHSQLSLQLHHHRAEHWIITSGRGVVTLGEDKREVKNDTAVYIPKETKHRIQNDTDDMLVFIEVQTGDYLDENDIERFEDVYGRV
ncbi:MAG: phosphomannose isomerase type II C-terminal cupin domain [Alphaproteobacteria bacterium]|nr:phosphomannose isomerase type II C-terminal cupin domain [Alphaproteobacteria bacterium]